MEAKKIIWADDEIKQLEPHILFLQDRGYEVMGVTSGEDAIEHIKKQEFDLVILDEMMPGMGGLNALTEIRKLDKRIPIIMITKSEEETLMEDAIGREITDYLVKPVNPHQILSSLKRVFESSRIVGQALARDYTSEYADMSSRLARADSSKQWLALSHWLAEWDVILDQHPELGLHSMHLEFRKECNSEFNRFILANYPRWIQSERDDRPRFSVDVARERLIPHLRQGKKVFFVVIDCMRLDQWLSVEPLLAEYFDVMTEAYFALLPTATPYCRNALFGGTYSSQIFRTNPELWDDPFSPINSPNRKEHQLLDKLIAREGVKLNGDTKYIKILDPEEGESLVHRLKSYLSASMTSVVVNFLDILAHSRAASDVLQEISPDESAYRSVMKTWFTHSSLFKALMALSREDVTIVLTTDHGSTIGRRANKAYGKKDTSTNLRYKFGENINCDDKGGILVLNPEDWKLPRLSRTTNYIIAKEDYYFVYPTRFSYYEKQYRNSFLHGGISIEEMVVPLVTLKSK